jgi:amidase
VAAAIRAGDDTSVQVLEDLIARIDKHNPALNAIVTLDAAAARRRAQDADAALGQNRIWGPLHGVPITIKDSFETAGLRTVSGYPPFANHVPKEDAPPVARLREAGAIILGKTNLPKLANGIQSVNAVFGRSNNPWDLARTPGGSSGGAAAAVAAALSYLDLGSDIGGSIRIPAHFCGVYGLKATGGRVTGKGHLASPKRLVVPPGWDPLLQLASFGPLARAIDDLRLCLPIIAEPATRPLESRPARAISDLRIAWTDDFGGVPLTDDSRRLMRELIAALERAGCRVERHDTANFDYDEAWRVSGTCLGAIDTLLRSQFTQSLRRLGAPILSALGPRDPLMQGLFAGLSQSPRRVREALERREMLIDRLEGFLQTRDAWLCPVFPSPAFTHRARGAAIEIDDRKMSQLRANLLHNIIFNVTGHPVVTMPIGRSPQGLPVGIQVVGRRWQEMALLDVSEQIAALTPGYRQPPGY